MISFILGSGFSIPEGIKSVPELNQRLKSIKEEEIYIHTSQNAFFIDSEDEVPGNLGLPERKFVGSFIEFYNEDILQDEEFHYEKFYDFYTAFLREEKNAKPINEFCNEFNSNIPEPWNNRGSHSWISSFNRTFNQLVGSLLENPTYYKDVSLGNYPPYDDFISFLRNILRKHEVKVHSLNHDLFFDYIGNKVSGLWEHFCDGFELQGSKIYGLLRREFTLNGYRIPKNYKVKLERFTGDFSGKLAFFKLHGSINSYIAYELGLETRIKRDYGISEFLVEHKPEGEDKYKMNRLTDSIYPDFLSGSTEKIYHYDNPYYKILFQHFAANLQESDYLIVIGYSFKDQGINNFINDNYLSAGKKMIVIDIKRPSKDLIDPKNYKLLEKSIIEITPEELESLL